MLGSRAQQAEIEAQQTQQTCSLILSKSRAEAVLCLPELGQQLPQCPIPGRDRPCKEAREGQWAVGRAFQAPLLGTALPRARRAFWEGVGS